MSSTSEWLHFHPNNNNNNTPSLEQSVPSSYAATSPPDLFFTGRASEPAAVSAAATPLQPGQARPGPDGRVSKPVRRRTRASRRTPTTLLNTDASNFRAMVQQFTGGPSIAFPSPSPPVFGVGPGMGYGLQQYGGASNSSPTINTNMFMQRNNNIGDYNYNAYVQNNTGSNNNNLNAGSSSTENRSSNNNNSFQY